MKEFDEVDAKAGSGLRTTQNQVERLGRRTLLDATVEIREELDTLREAMEELEMVRLNPSLLPKGVASRAVLASCDIRVEFPVLDPPLGFDERLETAAEGSLNHHARRALIALEVEAAAMMSANAALTALNALGEPFQSKWATLPKPLMARAVTKYAFILLKRVPG